MEFCQVPEQKKLLKTLKNKDFFAFFSKKMVFFRLKSKKQENGG